MKRQKELADTSQQGNYSQMRNAKYLEQPLHADSIGEWEMPEIGVLEFDYASAKRPPSGAPVLDEECFTNMLAMLQSPKVTSSPDPTTGGDPGHFRMQALRMVSHCFYISSLQLRELLGVWPDAAARAECLIAFFNRVTDMHNEKVFRVRFEIPEQLARLYNRLGHASYFPFIQPEQAHFHLDLAVHDQRLAAFILVTLASKEKRTNIQTASYQQRPDGPAEQLAQVPAAWEVLAKMPTEGTLEAVYECAPEDRRFDVRKELLETYGNWTMDASEEEVMWWGTLAEAPTGVSE